jgi:hypothetical protein
MAPLLPAVVMILTGAAAVNIMLLLKVIRRIRALEARLWPRREKMLPAVGTRVGAFQTRAADGSVITDADITEGVHYVAFVLVGCAVCKERIVAMRASGRFDPMHTTLFVVADDPSTEDAASVAEEIRDLGTVALMSRQNPVLPAVGGVRGFPTLLRVESGVVAAAGTKWAEIAQTAEMADAPVPALTA